jgi:hypothetical protein
MGGMAGMGGMGGMGDYFSKGSGDSDDEEDLPDLDRPVDSNVAEGSSSSKAATVEVADESKQAA